MPLTPTPCAGYVKVPSRVADVAGICDLNLYDKRAPGGIGGTITAPPSKSMAHRAVLCSALAVLHQKP